MANPKKSPSRIIPAPLKSKNKKPGGSKMTPSGFTPSGSTGGHNRPK